MTRKEAIQVLEMVEAHGSLTIQAKEMAIKSLEAWDKVLSDLDNAKEDYPDRYGFDGGIKAARDIIEKHMGDM